MLRCFLVPSEEACDVAARNCSPQLLDRVSTMKRKEYDIPRKFACYSKPACTVCQKSQKDIAPLRPSLSPIMRHAIMKLHSCAHCSWPEHCLVMAMSIKHTRVSGKRPTTAATKRALDTNPTLHQAQGVISSGFCAEASTQQTKGNSSERLSL